MNACVRKCSSPPDTGRTCLPGRCRLPGLPDRTLTFFVQAPPKNACIPRARVGFHTPQLPGQPITPNIRGAGFRGRQLTQEAPMQWQWSTLIVMLVGAPALAQELPSNPTTDPSPTPSRT